MRGVSVDDLDCINLGGLSFGLNGVDKLTDKLIHYLYSGDPLKPIDLRVNPVDSGRFLLLDGHHRAFSAYLFGSSPLAIVYDSSNEIDNPIARLNWSRAFSFHQTAKFLGRGRVRDLMKIEEYLAYCDMLSRRGEYLGLLDVLKNFYRSV